MRTRSATFVSVFRGGLIAAAAIATRRILVERARHYRRVKHGGEQHRVELDTEAPAIAPAIPDVLAIDQALTRLEQMDAQKAQVVMLRYFAGLTIEETAASIVSPSPPAPRRRSRSARWQSTPACSGRASIA